MDVDAILSKPVFSKISSEQFSASKELLDKLNGKTLIQAMPIVMHFMSNMPKGPELSPKEQEAMTEAVLDSLDEPERTKFKMMLTFIKR